MPADRRPEEVRAEIERYRQELSSSAVVLRDKMRDLADWHQWVASEPWAFVGGAFALGFIIGYRSR